MKKTDFFHARMSELGLDYTYLQVPAAHDWECWQLTFANAAASIVTTRKGALRVMPEVEEVEAFIKSRA